MKKLRNLIIIAVAMFVGLLSAGCSTINTPSDMVALHYDGGPWTASKFIECVPKSTYKTNGFGHTSYEYPTSLRYYDASFDPGAESGPIVVVSKDNAEMSIPVSVGLTLITHDCATLQVFHERISNRESGFWGGTEFADENKDGTPDGWDKILNLYVGKTVDATLDRAAQAYPWRSLWNDPAIKAKLEKEIEDTLSREIDERMGGHFFEIHDILVAKPDPISKELKDAVIAEQTAVAKAKAIEAEAEAQKTSKVKAAEAEAAAAQAQIAVSKAKAAQMSEEIRVLGRDAWLKKYGIDKGITPWPNPVVPGSNVK